MALTMSDADERIYRGQLGGDLYALERSAICVNVRAAWAELDATSAQLADERERRTETAADNVTLQLALAAAQADNARLREALGHVTTVPRDDYSLLGPLHRALLGCEDALAQPSDTSALRALLERAVVATHRQCEEYASRYRLHGLPFNSADVEAIVARVLKERSDDAPKAQHRSGEAGEGGGA